VELLGVYGSGSPLPFLIVLSLVLVVLNARAQRRSDVQEVTETGLQLAQTGEFLKAETQLRRAVNLFPAEPLPLVALGEVLGMQNRLNEGKVYFEKALKINPDDLVARRDLAASQWQLGQLAEARKNLQRALRNSPRDKQATFLLGMVEENLENYREAARLLGAVPELVRGQPEAVAALVRSYYGIADKNRVYEQVRILLKQPRDSQAAFLVARVATERLITRPPRSCLRPSHQHIRMPKRWVIRLRSFSIALAVLAKPKAHCLTSSRAGTRMQGFTIYSGGASRSRAESTRPFKP